MTEMQRLWYGNILTKNIDVINAMGGSRGQMHNILMHLRKCANHTLYQRADPGPGPGPDPDPLTLAPDPDPLTLAPDPGS
tara:strand:- start:305 stop:544 length:240 start_codon:yes stop_codon:yes gene_type:complete